MPKLSKTVWPKKNYFQNLFRSFSGKNLPFETFSRKCSNFLVFTFEFMKKRKQIVNKKWPSWHCSTRKTSSNCMLKISISELSKTAGQQKIWFPSYTDKKTRCFLIQGANSKGPSTVYRVSPANLHSKNWRSIKLPTECRLFRLNYAGNQKNCMYN